MSDDCDAVRLFIAAWPSDDVIAALAALPRPDETDVRWTAEETWHVTLRFVGTARPDDVRNALDDADLTRATVRLGPCITRLGRDSVVAPAAGAAALAAAVAAATAHVGRPPEDRAFNGHLTLARLRRRYARCSLLGHAVTGSFTVDQIHLVRSTPAPGGARYQCLASWPTT